MKQMEYSETFLEEQRQFLEDLISFREPIEKIKSKDKIGPIWDDQPEDFYLATLNRQDIISVLQRFLESELTAKDVKAWAEALEVRDPVKKEQGYGPLIFDILTDITLEDDIGYTLTPERAREMIVQLKTAQFDPEDD